MLTYLFKMQYILKVWENLFCVTPLNKFLPLISSEYAQDTEIENEDACASCI